VSPGDSVADQIVVNRMDRLAGVLIDGLEKGLAPDAIARQLTSVLGDKQWAHLVSLTETTRAVSEASLASYARNGVEAIEWMTAEDQRVCQRCSINEDQGPIPLGSVFPDGSDAPPGHPLCFPAGTVVAGPLATAATARRYEGDLVTVVFASGQELAVTPNHPVLSANGWVPAGDLHEGVQVLRASDVQRVLGLIHPDDRQAVARIEDVAGALREAGPVLAVSVPATPEDFHGDGTAHGEVDVVLAAGRSELHVQAEAGQQGGEARFVRAARSAGLGVGDAHPALDALRAASRLMGGGHQGDSLRVGGPGPAHRHGGGTVAPVDAGFAEHPVDAGAHQPVAGGEGLHRLAGQEVLDEVGRGGFDTPGLPRAAGGDAPLEQALAERLVADAAQIGALLHAGAGLVELDRVVEVRRVQDWAGHVYNLETLDGWYLADGVIVHNCRCSIAPAWLTASEAAAQGADLGPTLVSDEELAQLTTTAVEGETGLEDQIFQAYAQLLSTQVSSWVSLADLRDALAGASREEVDRALESLATQPGVHVIPWDNFKALTQRERAAAFRFGGQENHVIRIEPDVLAARLGRAERVVTGGSTAWAQGVAETGMDQPLSVRDVVIRQSQGDYTIAQGFAFKSNGIGYLVEGTDRAAAIRAAKDLERFQNSLGEAGRFQRTYTVTEGRNPADPYWAREYGKPDFRSTAAAQDGHTILWDPVSGLRYDAELSHELGHNVDSAAMRLGLGSNSSAS
jgi:hypothetical protein